MCHRSRQRNAEALARFDDGRRTKAGDVGGARRPDAGVDTVRAASAELHDASTRRRFDDARRPARDRCREHRLGDERSLDELRLRQRRGDAHDRFMREYGRSFVYRPDVAGKAERRKVVVEEGAWKIREGRNGPEEIDLFPGETKRLEKVERLFETCGDQEVTRGRKLPHKEIERGTPGESGNVIAADHRQLVEIS